MIAYPSIPATSILTSPATNEIAVVTTSSSVITSTTTTVESTSSPDNSNSIRNNQTTRCKSCILVPPESGFPSRLGKDKPPGCKTIFVGGLPENSTGNNIYITFSYKEIIMHKLNTLYFPNLSPQLFYTTLQSWLIFLNK